MNAVETVWYCNKQAMYLWSRVYLKLGYELGYGLIEIGQAPEPTNYFHIKVLKSCTIDTITCGVPYDAIHAPATEENYENNENDHGDYLVCELIASKDGCNLAFKIDDDQIGDSLQFQSISGIVGAIKQLVNP